MQSDQTTSDSGTAHKKHTLLWIFLTVIILTIAGLLSPPFLIDWYITRILADAGAVNTEIKNTDFNPFTGEVRIQALNAFPRKKDDILRVAEARLNYSWYPLWHHRIYIQYLELNQVAINIELHEDGSLTVGQLNFPPKDTTRETENGKWEIGFETLHLKDVTLHLKTQDMRMPIWIQNAEISGMSTWSPEQAGKASLNMTIDGHPLEFTGKAAPFAAEPYAGGAVEIDRFDLALLNSGSRSSKKKSIAGSLSSQGKIQFQISENNHTTAALTGDVQLGDLRLPAGNRPQFSLSTAFWNGTLKSVFQKERAEMTGEGKLTVERLTTSFNKQKYLFSQNTSEAEGTFTLTNSVGSPLALRIQASGSAAGLRLADNDHKEIIAQAEAFTVSRGSFSIAESISGEQFSAEGIKVLERSDHQGKSDDEPVFTGTIRKITLQDPQLHLASRRHLELPLVELDETEALVERNSERKIILTAAGEDLFGNSGGETEKKNAEKSLEESPFTFAASRIVARGENRLSFKDHSVPQMFSTTLAPYTLEINDLDSRDRKKEARINLDGKIGEYGKLSVKGTLRPFGEEKDMDFKINITEYDLTKLSPYTRKYNDYAVDRGQLNADISWEVKENHLDGLFDLNLIKPEFSKVADKDGESAGGRDISFEQGVSFVRDKDENIHLSIPVSGDIDNPQFRFDNIFWSAFGRTLRQSAFSYFAPIGVSALTGVTLPLGTLWVAGKLFNEMTSLRLDPIELDPLQSSIPAGHKKRMDQLAGLLDDRPDIELVICGIAAPQDLEALRQIDDDSEQTTEKDQNAENPDAEELQALQNLAQRRSQSVKNYLVNKGIGSERLVTCRPQFSGDGKARPLVELGI